MISRLDVLQSVCTHLATTTGRTVHLMDVAGQSVSTATLTELCPYAFVEPIWGTRFHPPAFVYEYSEVEFAFQIHSIGQSDEQAEWMSDKVRAAYLEQGNSITLPSGVAMMSRDTDSGPGPIENVGNELFSVTERFLIRVTQAD